LICLSGTDLFQGLKEEQTSRKIDGSRMWISGGGRKDAHGLPEAHPAKTYFKVCGKKRRSRKIS